MQVVLKAEHEVRNRLAELGLSEEILVHAVEVGYLAFSSCAENHPPQVPGFWAWGEAVRALREQLIPAGWTRCNDDNFPLTISPDGSLAIAVATADDVTGTIEGEPSTRSAKGSTTFEAVEANVLQLTLNLRFEEVEEQEKQQQEKQAAPLRATWFLLMHRAGHEVRCELSLPSTFNEQGRLVGWSERILLRPIPLDPVVNPVTPPQDQPDLDIAVLRRK